MTVFASVLTAVRRLLFYGCVLMHYSLHLRNVSINGAGVGASAVSSLMEDGGLEDFSDILPFASGSDLNKSDSKWCKKMFYFCFIFSIEQHLKELQTKMGDPRMADRPPSPTECLQWFNLRAQNKLAATGHQELLDFFKALVMHQNNINTCYYKYSIII